MFVPWLLLGAALLFLMQPMFPGIIRKEADLASPSYSVKLAVAAFQFLVAVYGGYFGAGIGILMLASLALLGIGNIHHMNALKAVLAAIINGVSVVIFVLHKE